jgi:hypothetical protein
VPSDGVIGPVTLSAVERRLAINAAPGASLECSRASLDQIVTFEVTSEAYYTKYLRRPTWPGNQSGVTIGIGYDLGHTSGARIEADWSAEVDGAEMVALLRAQGVRGPPAKRLATDLQNIAIPYSVATTIFFSKTVPRFAALTLKTFPGVESLPADAQGMLLSLIYNRGSSVKGATRVEMAAIQRLVSAGVGALNEIADEVQAMVRLWPNSLGLRQRREKEAQIIRDSNHAYDATQLVWV